MIECNKCGYLNRPGTLFCDDCGYNISDLPDSSETRFLQTDEMKPEIEHVTPKTPGTSHIHANMSLEFQITGTSNQIIVTVTDRVTIGRSDPSITDSPDVDLAPYGAIENGVSRTHAVIEVNTDNGLFLSDMNSSNGTYLNGQRLRANQFRTIHDGDEIRFGKLVTNVYFK